MLSGVRYAIREPQLRRLEAGIIQEIQEREATHSVMFTGLQEKLKASVATIEAEAEASITARFEPALLENVREFSFGCGG